MNVKGSSDVISVHRVHYLEIIVRGPHSDGKSAVHGQRFLNRHHIVLLGEDWSKLVTDDNNLHICCSKLLWVGVVTSLYSERVGIDVRFEQVPLDIDTASCGHEEEPRC